MKTTGTGSLNDWKAILDDNKLYPCDRSRFGAPHQGLGSVSADAKNTASYSTGARLRLDERDFRAFFGPPRKARRAPPSRAARFFKNQAGIGSGGGPVVSRDSTREDSASMVICFSKFSCFSSSCMTAAFLLRASPNFFCRYLNASSA